MELYLKYRPQTYDDVVGNDVATKALRGALEKGSRVFLLIGAAGTGKTTLARIAAKSVGATTVEINSASNRGIDTAREIIDEMRYPNIDGTPTAYIIDEAHKATNDWQNAMLKALEDTPKTAYFFLATTDPQKLIAPLKSRCTQIALKPLDDDVMFSLLKRISRAEGEKISSAVLDEIISVANGGSRKALKLLAQVTALETDEERIVAIRGADEKEDAATIDFCRALLSGAPWKDVAALIKSLDLSEPERVRYAVLGYANAVALNGNRSAIRVMEAFSHDTYAMGKFGITLAAMKLYERI